MSAEMAMSSVIDSRDSERVGLSGPVEFCCGPDETGCAQWENLSQTGAGLRLGRYLRPGRRIAIAATRPRLHDEPAELVGRVVWCRPNADGKSFAAGVAFESNDIVGSFAVSSMMREAFKSRLFNMVSANAGLGSNSLGNMQTAW
jgi:hypothetical protein